MASRTKASDQLKEYASHHKKSAIDPLTASSGMPIDSKLQSLTVGPRGPLLVQDFALLDEFSHYAREKVIERADHAKGGGAKGYFKVTHDIRKYCKAKVFDNVGKKTPVAVRFSTTLGESGSADTCRDMRGFAVKFYTEDGNWNLVGTNSPIFSVRDAIICPSLKHSQKRNPQTNLKDPDMYWDFVTLRPETTHQVTLLYTDRGIPDGYRHMHGYGGHAFKMVNKAGEAVYVKFHFKCDQGIKNLDPEKAKELEGTDPDYANRDLFNAIANGNFPSWTLKIQVMTFEEAEKFPYNPFDLTKIWPQRQFPLIQVGKMVLNENPKNYFAEVEQIAFTPSHMVPGIEPSPDKMLQARLFSYPEAQRHRLGTNYLQIPINCPFNTKVRNYQRDGAACFTDNHGGAPNYHPNSFHGPQDGLERKDDHTNASTFHVSGDVKRYNTRDEDNFAQVINFVTEVLTGEERNRLAQNIAEHVKDTQPFLQEKVVKQWSQVHESLGSQIKSLLDEYKKQAKK